MMGSARLFRSYGLTQGLIFMDEQPIDKRNQTRKRINPEGCRRSSRVLVIYIRIIVRFVTASILKVRRKAHR